MPFSPAVEREPIHCRVIDMQAYARKDGLFDAEAWLVDRKPFDFMRAGGTDLVRAGEPFHELRVRLTLDRSFRVHAVEASSDVTPYAVCKEAEAALSVLVGETLERGWSAKVKERLRGAAGCTHLKEMLLPLATTALMGVVGLRPEAERHAGMAALVDTCWAYERSGDVIKVLAPLHYVAPDAAAR